MERKTLSKTGSSAVTYIALEIKGRKKKKKIEVITGITSVQLVVFISGNLWLLQSPDSYSTSSFLFIYISLLKKLQMYEGIKGSISITHPSRNAAEQGLTSLRGQDAVLSLWYNGSTASSTLEKKIFFLS